MPRISCLGRKWSLASDDLFYTGFGELVFNTGWLALVIVAVFFSFPGSPSCEFRPSIRLYFIGMTVSLSVSELLIFAMIYISSRGTIMNDSPRQAMGNLLISRGCVRLVEFGFSLYAATFVFIPLFVPGHVACEDLMPVTFIIARISIVLCILTLVCWLIAFGAIYDPLGRARIQDDTEKLEHARKIYRERMNCCLYLCAPKHQTSTYDRSRVEAFRSIAELFAEYFESDDLAASDVLAGLILLNKQHRTAGVATVRYTLHQISKISSFCSASARETLEVLDAHGVLKWPSRIAPSNRVDTCFDLYLKADGSPNVLPQTDCDSELFGACYRALDWLDVRVLQRTLQFAAGIYGWAYYALKESPCNALASLAPELRCCKSRCYCCCCCCCFPCGDSATSESEVGQGQNERLGDNCCEGNFAALLQETGVRREDVLFASWLENGLHRVAFAIVVDHALRSVVVTIRGTLSIGDVLTDIGVDLVKLTAPTDSFEDFLDVPNNHPSFQPSCEPDQPDDNSFDRLQLPDDVNADEETDAEGRRVYLVHGGILHATLRLRSYIEQRKLLESAFTKYPNYKLIITGHSLGAGVSALLGWSYAATSYRQSQESSADSPLQRAMKSLVCYAFAPPGGLVSRFASLHLGRFVCSPFLGDDIVPRMSMPALMMLKNELHVVISDCDTPKYRVIASGCWQLFCRDKLTKQSDLELVDSGTSPQYQVVKSTESLSSDESDLEMGGKVPRRGNGSNRPLLKSKSESHSTEYLLSKARQLGAARAKQQPQLKLLRYPRTYAPGILVQLRVDKLKDKRDRQDRLIHRLELRSCDDLQRVVISPHMIAHHIPAELQTALNSLVNLIGHGERIGVLPLNDLDLPATAQSAIASVL